ncbi:uncharacterized protein LOC105431034 [Pogonomyrmex barbatus]|uniref:Uncharacterized protein LOC105431034 n=1 Tax=Pogonomyrmex barbatus TaxID=144034 RepID=A0A6I9WJI6_9HYME|nr:uncharacterized protein LOC105431034 [Pogonomyrmex barbatus]
MNLALHGFLLQVFVSILDFYHGRLLCSAGEPGYLDFDNLPETNFSCQGKVIGGYYADVEAGCQMFHVCTIGQKDEIMDIKFLCLNGTVFDQETRVCERVDEVDCSKSERFYNLNLELYGNNAVTLSLNGEDEDALPIDSVEDHQTRITSARPSTTSSTSTSTTSRPGKPSTTAASGSFQHPAGYPQHYQPQPPFPQVHTSQSKSLYDDKNGGYHHQYIFHNGGERASNQATSYQLFSNQGAVSSTTVPPASPPPPSPPQIHQIRYSSTVGPPPQIIHNEPSTVTPLFHATSSTIQTLLNSNANSPALINPIFHNHGIASTTEQFTVHSNNPRETTDYRDDNDQEQDIRTLEAIQPANKGKISKLAISPLPSQQETLSRTVQTKTSQTSQQQQQQQQRIPGNFLPTPTTVETTVRSFYPTPRSSPKPLQMSQSVTHQVSQHIHVSPSVTVPQLKHHQITINLPPPDIQRIVQNPSPLLPSQSRVIVTAKASVSDESGRPLNTTQLVTLPLPTIPASYDDYKEGDESFDPFYRDVPKIRKNRQATTEKIKVLRKKRSLDQPFHFIYGVANDQSRNFKVIEKSELPQNENNAMRRAHAEVDYRTIKDSLIKFKDVLFSNEENDDSFRKSAEEVKNNTESVVKDGEIFDKTLVKQEKDNAIKRYDLRDLSTEASEYLNLNKNEDKDEEMSRADFFSNVKVNTENKEKSLKELEINLESTTLRPRKDESRGDVIDVIILDSDNDFKVKAASKAKTDAPIEIIIEEETKSGTQDASKTNEKVAQKGHIAGYLTKDESNKQLNSVAGERRQPTVPHETIKRKSAKDSGERKSGSRRKGLRSRSSKRRISSRIKQQRTDNVEAAETIQSGKDVEDTTTTTTTITTPTTTTSTTTMTPSVALLDVAEQIDSHIFGDNLESQTFKELGTRAIGQRDAIYSKSLQDGKSYHAGKNKEIERSFEHQIVDNRAIDSELRVDKREDRKRQTESTNYTQNDEKDATFIENPRSVEEEAELTEVTRVSEEEKFSNEQSDDDFNANNGEFEENLQDEVVTSHELNSELEESYPENANEKSGTDVLDEVQRSTTRYSEEVEASEELNEYQDITESSAENTRNIQEDYKESESTESSITLADYTNSEEYTDSQEDVAASTEDAGGSTEGVLKFTDELSKSDDEEDAETTEETSASDESNAHDYIDDNYEPENYKEMETTVEPNDFEKNEEKDDEEKKDTTIKELDYTTETTQRIDDSAEAETQTEYAVGVTKIENLHEIASLTTTSSSTTTSSTTSTTSSTSTTTTTTTPRPKITRRPTTTTTIRPPKLFKPTGNRRIYAYIPPTTTPNSVVIKPRLGLYNPKPAKPPKSYNELAPKPIIRKLTLSRKPSITTAATTTIITTTMDKLNTENLEISTEPVTMTMMTEVTKAMDTTTMTPTMAPETTVTEATTAATTTSTMMTETTETITTAATTTTPATTSAVESGRSEENVLETKLEANDHIFFDPSKNDQKDKEDQLPSPSEQNTSANSSKSTDSAITIKTIETFTPYPLSKLSTLESSAERTTKMTMDVNLQDTTEESDEILTTTVSPTTLPFKKTYEYAEITSSTEKYLEAAKTSTTTSTFEVYPEDIVETTSVSSIPPVPERATPVSILTTVSPKAEDTDSVTSTGAVIVRPNGRKSVIMRKHASFNCLEKEMYRFYGDTRDCRLFHYCSPGFTSRQVLDFRFVCEEGTTFDEVTQSCRHDVPNRKCRNRSW